MLLNSSGGVNIEQIDSRSGDRGGVTDGGGGGDDGEGGGGGGGMYGVDGRGGGVEIITMGDIFCRLMCCRYSCSSPFWKVVDATHAKVSSFMFTGRCCCSCVDESGDAADAW